MGLVLTRRPGETIHIGDDMILTVNYVDGEKVDFSVRTPSEKRDMHARARQMFHLSPQVCVSAVEVRGRQTRFLIQAPLEIHIVRGELLGRDQRTRKRARRR
jgi:sRNA-binding carbon storage regulator CsrA